jgi:hypothetical protein
MMCRSTGQLQYFLAQLLSSPAMNFPQFTLLLLFPLFFFFVRADFLSRHPPFPERPTKKKENFAGLNSRFFTSDLCKGRSSMK